jgi:hemolysin activation/secretion protein
VTVLQEDRRFLYPWVQFDLIQDDFLRLWNHDQLARTEDFYLGTSFSMRAGVADAALGSSSSAAIFQSNVSTGFRHGSSTLLLYGDFSGRVSGGALYNGLMDGSVRYYVEQSKNWLFFTTLVATKGWRLDLDNQILLGGDNGLRGYPLRYQGGTERALFSVEQRYFTDWYPFRLFRVGGAVFFDAGRTWGKAPLASPSLGLLKDAGFGLRFGNSRSGLGNVIHVDLAFPFDGDSSIKRVQFLVTTSAHF